MSPKEAEVGIKAESTNIKQHMVELRQLLEKPAADRNENWQADVERLIALISVDFGKQTDDRLALEEIALVAYAATNGSKAAKKRQLRPLRWIDRRPPPLSEVFDNIEDATCALKVLHPLTGDWINSYVLNELFNNSKFELNTLLIEWALLRSKNLAVFVKHLSQFFSETVDDPLDKYLKIFPALLKCHTKSSITAGDNILAEVNNLVNIIQNRSRSSELAQKKGLQLIASYLIQLIDQASIAEPSVLLQPSASAFIFNTRNLSGKNQKISAKKYEALFTRTLDLLRLKDINNDPAYFKYVRRLIEEYSLCSKSIISKFSSYAMSYPQLSQFSKESDYARPEEFELGAHIVEHKLCELAANWEEFFQVHSLDPAVQQINERLSGVLVNLSIFKIGLVGEKVNYDPICHFLKLSEKGYPNLVTILKPGYKLNRNNDSYLVLLPALVAKDDF